MYKMTKFYCILLDSTGLIPYLHNVMIKKHNFKIIDQITGGSTMFTLPMYFTGSTPSQYIKNGLGWLSYGKKGDWAQYLSRNLEFNPHEKFNWLDKKDLSLFHLLDKNKCNTIVHNTGPCGKFIKSNLTLDYSKCLSEFKNIKFTYSNPKNALTDEYIKNIGGFRYLDKWIKQYGIKKNLNELISEHYKQQKKYIRNLQKTRYDNLFYFENENAYHDGKGEKLIETYLNCWDFNEPDSVFWIFCDHYTSQSRFYPPRLYYTWAMVKDNRKNPIKVKRNIMAAYDFYDTVLDIFKIPKPTNYPILSKSITKPLDKNRIYFIEDARLRVTNFDTDTYTAIKVLEWKGNRPNKMIQLTYCKGMTQERIIDDDIEGICNAYLISDYSEPYRSWNTVKSIPFNLEHIKYGSLIKELLDALLEKYPNDIKKFDDLIMKLSKRVISDGKKYWLFTTKYRRFINLKNNTTVYSSSKNINHNKVNTNNVPILSKELIVKKPKYNHKKSLEYSKSNKLYDIDIEESACLYNMYNSLHYQKFYILKSDLEIPFFKGLEYYEHNSINTYPIFKIINNISEIPNKSMLLLKNIDLSSKLKEKLFKIILCPNFQKKYSLEELEEFNIKYNQGNYINLIKNYKSIDQFLEILKDIKFT